MDRTEHTVSSNQVLQGSFLQVFRDNVRLPDGAAATREYIKHPGAVVVVPQLPDGRFVLERQYRYPLHRDIVEFPAGKLESGEVPIACAERELREETGYSANEWAYAGFMNNAVAYADEAIHIFFAKALICGERQLDSGEFLEVFAASFEDLLQWSRDGTITDAKTLTCLLWLQNVRSGLWQLDWKTKK